MPTYKLHYFNLRARGELIRLLFAVADVRYEDHRIDFKDWLPLKPTFLFQQLPVLEFCSADGKTTQINQSGTIAMFLAKEFGLAGSTHLEAAQMQALGETISDMLTGIFEVVFSKTDSEEVKAKKLAELREERLTKFLEAFEKYFKANLSASGYIVGNKLSMADLAFFNVFDQLHDVKALEFASLLAAYPTLSVHYKVIRDHPRLKSYLATRPAGP
jgi:glutathione S-transferase